MVTWQRRGSLGSLRVMGITAFGRSSLFSFTLLPGRPLFLLAGGPGRLERGYAELRPNGVLRSCAASVPATLPIPKILCKKSEILFVTPSIHPG